MRARKISWNAELRLEAFLPYRINVLAAVLSRSLARIYETRYGIGIPEWRVLATLGQFGRSTARDIVRHTHMHKTKVSRAVGSLASRGLVERRPNPDDRRAAFLSLTAAGRAVYDDLVPKALAFSARLEQALSPADRKALDAILVKLMTRSQALARDVPMVAHARGSEAG